MSEGQAGKYEFDFTGYSVQDHLDFMSLVEKTATHSTALRLFVDPSTQCLPDAQDIWVYLKFLGRFLVKPTLAEVSFEELPELLGKFTGAFQEAMLTLAGGNSA